MTMLQMNYVRILWRALCALVSVPLLAADVPAQVLRLPAIFSDNMVLQADAPVPVWGWADAGEEVTVLVANQTVTAKADEKGKWKLVLASMKPLEKVDFIVKGRASTLAINNVMVGEVWIAAGQSNMGLAQGNKTLIPPVSPVTDDPQLRLFITKEIRFSEEPLDDFGRDTGRFGHWMIADAKTIREFSAVGYYFGRDLRTATKRPVGLIQCAIGGIPAQSFISRTVLSANPELKPLLEDSEKQYEMFKKKAFFYDENQESIIKQYEADVEQAKKDGKKPPEKPLRPKVEINPAWAGVMYNTRIAPLIPYAMKGVIWYQGESNDVKEYRTLFTTMLDEWRREWGQGDFPFLFVQITYHNAYFREVQDQIAKTVPKTGMVVISDHGRRGDSHPVSKEAVGVRLALTARSLAYGENIEASGPVYESVKFEAEKAIVSFSHLGGGLLAREGTLKGFQLAGDDKVFFVADAKIVGDTVVVTCDKVKIPISVRYGFLDRPITKEICEANGCVNDNFGAAKYCPGGYLANKAGLTAAPFRSDTWPPK